MGCRTQTQSGWCGNGSDDSDSEESLENDDADLEAGELPPGYKSTQSCYIMTIGVIDECRRYGLGTKLLLATNQTLIDFWPNCVVLYLHVIDYNQAAIRFYERNGFTRDANVI